MFHDLGFAANYQCEVLPGLPGSGSVPLQFHRQGRRTSAEGLVIRIIPNQGVPWIGNFQRGDGGVSGVYATPSIDVVCVVARGQGYIIPVEHPSEYQLVQSYPVKEILPILQSQLIVFADFVKLSAYGPEGFVWGTRRLSWDGIKIISATPELIHGLAWDSPLDREVEFFVDVRTGQHEGGSSPEKYVTEKKGE